jgi:hypothetical protein
VKERRSDTGAQYIRLQHYFSGFYVEYGPSAERLDGTYDSPQGNIYPEPSGPARTRDEVREPVIIYPEDSLEEPAQ